MGAISGVMSALIWVMIIETLLTSPLVTTHEPPSATWEIQTRPGLGIGLGIWVKCLPTLCASATLTRGEVLKLMLSENKKPEEDLAVKPTCERPVAEDGSTVPRELHLRGASPNGSGPQYLEWSFVIDLSSYNSNTEPPK